MKSDVLNYIYTIKNAYAWRNKRTKNKAKGRQVKLVGRPRQVRQGGIPERRQTRQLGRSHRQAGQTGRQVRQGGGPDRQAGQTGKQVRLVGRAGQTGRQLRQVGTPNREAYQTGRQTRLVGRPDRQAGQIGRHAER